MLSLYLSMVNNTDDSNKISYIYQKYYAYMSYCAEQVLGQRTEDIKDATYNAMLKIIEHIDYVDLSDERRAKSYFGTIAKNKAKDILKSKYNKVVSIDDIIDCKDSESDINIVRFEYESLIDSIFKLDEKYRDVLILKYVNELNEREISNLLDIPQKTVSTRVLRGKKRLMAILKEDSDGN